jgi:O-antigen biosynthesis protein
MARSGNGTGSPPKARLRWLLRRADRARDRRDYAAAARLYHKALARDHRRTETRLQLAQMFKELARFSEAEAAFRQVLALSPSHREAHLRLAELLTLLGRRDEAILAYSIVEETRRAAAGTRQHRVIPTQPPSGISAAGSDTVEEHVREGDRLRDARQFAAAAEAYARALELAPDRADLRIQYGNMLKDAGHVAEAEAAYREALAQRRDDPEIHLQLGHALKLQGKRAEALDAYRRAGHAQPRSFAASRELFHAGCEDTQHDLFERQLALGGVEALLALTDEVAQLQGALDRLTEALPDLHAQMAFPVSSYDRYRQIYDVPPPAAVRHCRFAVPLAAYGLSSATLYDQIASLTAQTHPDWQLLVLGSSSAQRSAVERAAANDPRIRWIGSAADEDPAAAERRIAPLLDADWLILLAPGALLHPHALAWVADIAGRERARAYVIDEETVIREYGTLRRSKAELRHVVDYDTLLEANPFGDTVAVRADAYAEVTEDLVTGSISAARSSLLLNLAAHETVGHIPLPLVARSNQLRLETAASVSHEAAVRAHLNGNGLSDRIEVGTPSAPGSPLAIDWKPQNSLQEILVVVPTRDNGEDLGAFVESLRARAEIPEAIRMLVLDNASRGAQTRRVLDGLANEAWAQVISVDEPFNWSRFNNRAVALTQAPLLVFANDDMLMLSDGWDRRLRGLLERPEIGTVGARLIYPDDTLQHAGIVLGWEGNDVHDGRYEPLTSPGPAYRWHVTRSVSAVTGAFLATRREIFEAIGGFDEAVFPVAYGDVDFALKLRDRGLKVLWTPTITLRHYESKTRGLDHLDPDRAARYAAERRRIGERWGTALEVDPSVNPSWHRATLPFRLLSAPSPARLWRHIRLCASANPWLPDMDRADDARPRVATGTDGS